MLKSITILAALLLASTTWAQSIAKKYPWQWADTGCTKDLMFCWYGADLVKDPEVTAHGNRWVSQDKDEKPYEWVTEVRCIQVLRVCILARNQKIPFGSGTQTNVDLYHVKEWSDYEIRAVGENDFSHGKECEIDTLLLNRVDASVSMLSVPGPAAATKACDLLVKPNTVMFRLEQDSSKPEKGTP